MPDVFFLTLKEIARKRVFLVGLLLTVLYLALFALALHYATKDAISGNLAPFMLKQMGYQFMCMGWYLSTFLVGTLVIMIASGGLAQEIESGTILGLASRPLSRGAILSGKFLAFLLTSIIYSVILLTSIALLCNHAFQLLLPVSGLFLGVLIFLLFPLVLLAVTFLGSSALSTMATGVACFFLFALAIVGGFIEQIGAILHNTSLINVGIAGSLIIPSDSVYRLAIHHAGGELGSMPIAGFGPFGTASLPSTWMLVYTIIYIVVLLTLAWRKFNQRDF